MSSFPPPSQGYHPSHPPQPLHGPTAGVSHLAAAPPLMSTSTATTIPPYPATSLPSMATAAAIRPTNNKRPLMTTTKDGKQLSEKKLRRLEKNRLSARECRRRKREATENLLHEINALEGENLRLRLQLRIGEEAEETHKKEQEKVTEEIDDLLKSGASEAEIYATIEEFKQKFADYGRDRRSAIEFHLSNIERLLMPTRTTSVAMRALQGGQTANIPPQTPQAPSATELPASDATSTDSATATATSNLNTTTATTKASPKLDSSHLEPKKLFEHLVQYLEVSPEQATALKDSRWVARDLDDSLAKSFNVLQKIRTRLNQIGDGLETEFDNVRSILTPTQAAKFLVWVANNRACIHMLNELWSRVYADPNEDGDSAESGDARNSSI